MTSITRWIITALLAFSAAVSCNEDAVTNTDGNNGTDSDDTDSSDTSYASDADTDTDGDADTETDPTEPSEPTDPSDSDSASDTDTVPDSDADNCSFTTPVPGWASEAGGTTGGGTDFASAITVSSSSELKAAAGGNDAKIILVQPGNYDSFSPGSNKTIIGLRPGVNIEAPVRISGQSNVILRNVAIKGAYCATYDECRAGNDGVYIGNDAHHVWLDHVDISDGQDGNCDITHGANYITISWSKFWYSTSDKDHQFSNLIAGSDDEPDSIGKLKITYMNNWWGQMVETRQPRGRYGDIHMLNNLHNSADSQTLHGVGKDMALIAENCVYNTSDDEVFTDMTAPRGWKGIGNIGTAGGLNETRGTVFTIPYAYTAMPASEVEAAITAANGGAGNKCTFQ